MAIATILATTFLGITVSTWITIASIAYQVVQARKMKKAAREAAEARKGFEVVVEGESVNLPVIYGRAKVGGVRTYHNVANNFNYVTPNSDRQFVTEGFSTNLTGEKNEYLFYQQALCQGPIHRVYDIVFDESRYIDDSDIGKSVTQLIDNGSFQGNIWTPAISDRTDIKAGFRVDLHYGNTPVADSIMTANFPERSNSKFTLVKDTTGLAYASVAIKLNRDEPQFNAVPSTQFFIEGKKVFDIIRSGTAPNYSYSLSSTRTYSNNPALCLLDYLTDNTVGKSLSLSQIDLESFYDAKVIANTTVQSSVTTGGKLWQPTDGSRNITSRNLPLYECNIIIDTQKPIRENVESILATMGDARLVWSSGKYKLNLQYPTSNSALVLAAELTDEDLVLDDNVQINWPTASERLNNCTVRFHNESENFKEDTVSWPPKTTGSSLRGVGGFKYPVKGGFSTDNYGGRFLNSYGVWAGDSSTTTLSYKFYVRETGVYTFDYTGDDQITVVITNANTNAIVLNTGQQGDWGAIKTASISLVANTVYSIQINGGDTGGLKGVAAKLHRNNFIVWTTRSDAYTGFITVNTSSSVYDQMKLEDSGLELETDIFADGITDYYHALAKAEELVRTSRSAFGITFKYVIKNTFLEPGDFISLDSNTLQLGQTEPLYLRVNQVKVTDESTCEVTATRFDYTQLAWNIKDDEYLKPNNAYNFSIDQPRNLTYTAESVNILSSIGKLDWDDNSSSELSSYIIYVYTPGNVNPDGTLIWTELGRSIESQFTLPALTLTSGIFGVRSLTKGGKLSEITTTELLTLIPAVAGTAYIMSLSNDSISLSCDKDGNPVTGQLPKEVTIKVTKGEVVYTTGVTYNIVATGCTAGLSGSTITITAVTDPFAKITATATIGTLVLTKEISISKSKAGIGAITGLLTNESAIVAANSLGVVASFAGTGGTFKVFDGLIDKTGVGVEYSVNSSTGLTIDIASTGDYTITDMSADTGTATLRAIYNGVTVDKVYSLAKSKSGATGTPGTPGTAGNKTITLYLYQWSTTQPGNPSGETSYNWSDLVNSNYTGGNNWQVAVPTNPGTSLIKLWIATKTISAVATETVTTVDWTTGVSISTLSQNGSNGTNGLNGTNGAAGLNVASPRLYQTGFTIPTPPAGTSTYIWAATPPTPKFTYNGANGWSTSPPASSVGLLGQTLWVATVNLSDSATNETTTINWVTASISAESYYATNGTTPVKGVDYFDGINGTSIKVQYSANNVSWHDTPLAGDLYIRTGTKANGASDYTYAAGVKFVPEKGVEYDDGDPGVSSYLHIKYSENANGNPMSETPGAYIGTYTDSNPDDSTDYTRYTWARIKGDTPVKGVDYFDGINGTSVKVQYSADNFSWHDTPLAGDLYIRTGTKANGASDYTYAAGVKFVPEKGVEYDDGDPGISSYLHIKYSNDNGASFTANNGETPGDYIGTYTDSNPTDSLSTSSYTWARIKGADSTTPGPSGPSGASARVAYAVTTTTPSSTPSSVTVSGDNLPTTGSWFSGVTWSTNSPASLSEGQFLYQVDGIYNPASGVNSTTWQGIPYLSSLKVGNLAAISTNTGQLTVTDTIKVGSTASTSNGVLITTNGIEIYNAGVLRVKLGSI